MSDLPSELCREILLRVPAESLLRLRNVCKAWLHIIDDPSFVRAHTSSSHTLIRIKKNAGDTLFSFSLDSLDFTDGPQMLDATRIVNLTRNRESLFSVASCNGLLLMCNELVILNPLTNECHYMPKPKVSFNASVLGYGIGYDSFADDYKVVRIHRFTTPYMKVHQTSIYSLKSDSWRVVEDSPCGIHQWNGTFLNNALYWPSSEGEAGAILVFDLRTERYRQLPLPPVIGIRINFRLGALDGCLICSLNYRVKETFYGWVMKDNGWIKLFSLQYSVFHAPFDIHLAAYLKKKEQVLVHHDKGFWWLDIVNNSIKKLSIHGLDFTSSQICSTSSLIFPGSLVRLDDYHNRRAALPEGEGKRKREMRMETKRTDTRLKFCVRDVGEMCCSDNFYCSEDSCWRCNE